MSGGQGRPEKVTWNRALKDEVKLTKQNETRRQRKQHGQKPPWQKSQSQMKVIHPEHKHKPQSKNKKRDWRVAGVRLGRALGALGKKVGLYPKSSEKSQKKNSTITSRCSIHPQWMKKNKCQSINGRTAMI